LTPSLENETNVSLAFGNWPSRSILMGGWLGMRVTAGGAAAGPSIPKWDKPVSLGGAGTRSVEEKT
jgi:hypothetical protein